MKRLFVVRHGKAEAKHPDGDFNRALAPRGQRDAESLGQWSQSAHVLGSPVLTSAAVRTTQTTALLREAWQADETAITVLEEGYLASDRAWLGWINALDNLHDQAWIVGHNPGLSELVERGELRMRHIEQVYDLSDIATALKHVERGRTVGKVAIRCGGEVAVGRL